MAERPSYRPEFGNPNPFSNPLYEPASNGSALLELNSKLGDIKATVDRLDERSLGFRRDIDEIKLSVRGLPSQRSLFSLIAIAVTVLGLLVGAFWKTVDAEFGTVYATFRTVNARIDGLKD